MDVRKIDVAIIGGGAAGLTAGIYAANGGMNAVIFESLFQGGKLVNIAKIDNYPGFSNGIDGYTLAHEMQLQSQRVGVHTINEAMVSLDLEHTTKVITTTRATYESQCVIIACGARERHVGIDNEERLTGHGMSYCAVCDGAFYRDKRVAVIGGGDTALSDAIYLSRFARRVFVLHRRDVLRASAVLQTQARKCENVEFIMNVLPKEAIGETSVTAIMYEKKSDGQMLTLPVDGIFAAVGLIPNTELLTSIPISLTPDGYIVTDENMNTNISGVFAAGDIRRTPLRQVVTACADGAVAAQSAIEYINSIKV